MIDRTKLKRRFVDNSFCPTGEGGGVDPTCSPGPSREFASTWLKQGFQLIGGTKDKTGRHLQIVARSKQVSRFDGRESVILDCQQLGSYGKLKIALDHAFTGYKATEGADQEAHQPDDFRDGVEIDKKYADWLGIKAGNQWKANSVASLTKGKPVINPFVSEQQRRWMWANDPEMAQEWADKTPKGARLPRKVRKIKIKPTSNASKLTAKAKRRVKVKKAKSVNPVRFDPSKTATLQRGMLSQLRKQFALLKGAIVKLVEVDDAFGLASRVMTNQSLQEKVDQAAKHAEPNPTPDQIEAGNYKKGHVTIQGLPITIETAARNKRKPWHDRPIAYHYGYIKQTESEADGDHVDVFLGPHLESEVVFVVDQNKDDGSFDEHKCMIGFLSAEQAKRAYYENYGPDWKGFAGIKAVTMSAFKEWVHYGTGTPIKDQLIYNSDPDGDYWLDQATGFQYVANADRLIEVDDVRQPNHYFCGAAAVTSVAHWFGWDLDKDVYDIAEVLGTTLARSTDPQAVVAYFAAKSDGLVQSAENMTIEDLREQTDAGRPVIVCVQDYGDRREVGASFEYGHFLTVLGAGYGYIFAQDSSLENWEKVKGGDVPKDQEQPYNIDAPGRIMVHQDEFLRVWHDKDVNGRPYVHWGCAVGKVGVTDNYNPAEPRDADGKWTDEGERVAKEWEKLSPKEQAKFKKNLPSFKKWREKVASDVSQSKQESTSQTGIIRVVSSEEQSGKPLEVLHKFEGVEFNKITKEEWGTLLNNPYLRKGDQVTVKSGATLTDSVNHAMTLAAKWRQANYKSQSQVNDYQAWQSHLKENQLSHNYSPDQPRDSQGRFGYGTALAKAKDVMNKIPGAKWMGEKTAQIIQKLTDRYGSKQAMAIVASGQAFGWGLTVGGTIMTGVPVYVPFSTIVGMVPGAALAEVAKQLRDHRDKPIERGAFQSAFKFNVEQLTKDQIDSLGQDLVDELMAAWRDKPASAVTNAGRYEFHQDADKIQAFQDWLRIQFKSFLTGKNMEQLWDAYIKKGFDKGVGRMFDDLDKSKISQTPFPDSGDPSAPWSDGFYRGTKEEFIRSAFAQPINQERVKLMAGRAFDDLEGVTDDMSLKMSSSLTDSLIAGDSPHDAAKDLAEQVDISRARAETIARTEIIRAHAEGQLTALEQMGVEEVGVAVEWQTTGVYEGPGKVCELCQSLEGVVLKIDEARGLLPRHPNCRCCFIPANVGEDDDEQKDTKKEIDAALEEAGIDDVDISKARPQSILNAEDVYGAADFISSKTASNFAWLLENAFCPTGPGGGVDPTCSPQRTAREVKVGFLKTLRYGMEGLNDETKVKYLKTALKVIEAMPEKAQRDVSAYIRKAKFYANMDDLNTNVGNLVHVGPKQKCGGCYSADDRQVYLDGDKDAGAVKSADGTYAHEFTHAIDWANGRLSSNPEWREAWAKELRDAPPSKGLSNYARKKASEGFAEFGRAIYGGKIKLAVVDQLFPDCSKVFKENGLWPTS